MTRQRGFALTPRKEETRESTSRKKLYKPPSNLDAPDPKDPDTVHTWVRVAIRNEDDATNVSVRRREGWEFVRAEDYPHFGAPVHQEGKYAGVIGVGDLVLAVNSRENVEARETYFQNVANRAQEAVDNDLLSQQNPAMPITVKRDSGVTHGARKVDFDD